MTGLSSVRVCRIAEGLCLKAHNIESVPLVLLLLFPCSSRKCGVWCRVERHDVLANAKSKVIAEFHNVGCG